jgi:hypothetical protein
LKVVTGVGFETLDAELDRVTGGEGLNSERIAYELDMRCVASNKVVSTVRGLGGRGQRRGITCEELAARTTGM